MALADRAPSNGMLNRLRRTFGAWQTRLVTSPDFQRWASRFPLTRPFVRRDAAALYDLLAGFVYTQVLLACIDLDLLRRLRRGPAHAEDLAAATRIPVDRMDTLCRAATAIGLMARSDDGAYRLGRLGAAADSVPGLADMISHNRLLYEDLSDPVALLRGKEKTALSEFWPYVNADGRTGMAVETAEAYSALMASSQRLVAEETLAAISFADISHLLDVGGGTGAFLGQVAADYPQLNLTLFDLPAVADAARRSVSHAGLSKRIRIVGGSFVDDDLPPIDGAISLVRILYDHDDATVRLILRRAFRALAPGGRIVVSEPMSGGARPSRSGDAYFGFYTMAMTTGQPRSPARHRELLLEAGFQTIQHRTGPRPFLTEVICGSRP
ncbi:MAG: methyltransferase [Pseudomonadota bacterium]